MAASVAEPRGVSRRSGAGGSDELTRSLRETLRHQVADLAVRTSADGVVVTGRSRTYHGKQLVTHAILAAVPGTPVRNEVVVG